MTYQRIVFQLDIDIAEPNVSLLIGLDTINLCGLYSDTITCGLLKEPALQEFNPTKTRVNGILDLLSSNESVIVKKGKLMSTYILDCDVPKLIAS